MKKESITIKLIAPRMSLRPMDTEMKRRMSPPLSLVTLASMTPSEHTVYIEDENIGELSLNDTPDLVGITVNVDTVYRAIRIAQTYRERGIRVVFGGIHASAYPQDLVDACDAICIGEAEHVWHEIIADCMRGELKRQYNHAEPTDLSLVPVARWDFITRKEQYLYYNIIVTSRGCPFTCDFCYNSCDYVSKKYRNRPVEIIIAEIRAIGSRQVMFIDDNFIGNIAWTNRLLDQMEDMRLVWHAAVSANIVHHPELVERMAACGCRSLFIGFESIHEGSIRSVNKQQNKIGDYERLIQLLHDHGIMVNASLVFGFDTDTLETFAQTLDWLVRNRIETMTAHILTPYPGTVLYRKLDAEGRIICRDLEKYNTSHVVFQPVNLTPKELQDGYTNLYKSFYSWRNIWRRRPQKKRILASYVLFNLGYRKFGRLVAYLGRFSLMNRIGQLARHLSYGV